MRRVFCGFCLLMAMFLCAPGARAAAQDISGKELVTAHQGVESVGRLFDGRFMESVSIRPGGSITLSHEQGIGSLYIQRDQEAGEFSVINEDTGAVCTFGEAGFLHEFLDLEAAFGAVPQCVTLEFGKEETKLCEIYAFSAGETPDWVQKWMPPAEGEADLALFSTHGDDEQLFFAGMLPYYARELGYNVQVVYMTGHRNMSMRRSHEMLDGLWAVGVRNYPVFGPFGDYNTRSMEETYQKYRDKGYSKEDILSFVVENVRRFRPKVAVGHDLLGEYGHGMHMVYADLLCKASEIAMDPEAYPESAEIYGVWDIPKTYLHLYEQGQIWMNWDIPLESFDGMTAYEVTRFLGFPCHVSQQTYYSSYFEGKETAGAITENSPCEFGLYRSTVGEDLEKRDFFENVTTHAEDAMHQTQQAETHPVQTEPAQTEPMQTVPPETMAEGSLRESVQEPSGMMVSLFCVLGVFAAIALILIHKNKK